MFVRLTKTYRFEAAHWLPCFPEGHKCRRLHGHSFVVDVVVAGNTDGPVLVDYADISAAAKPVVKELDHQLLNDIVGLECPTSEVLARWLWGRLAPLLGTVQSPKEPLLYRNGCLRRGCVSGSIPMAPARYMPIGSGDGKCYLAEIVVHETCTCSCQYTGSG